MISWIVAGALLVQGGFLPAKRGQVTYVAEPQVVVAGKATKLQLRFHVADGFHVNSHTPRSEFLIPTRLEVQPADGVKAGAVVYPAGKDYSFSFSPQEKLDVYSEDFVVELPVAAAAGQHEMSGELKYQACDKAACYPPKTLEIKLLFTAK